MSMQVYLTAVRLAWASMVARVRFGYGPISERSHEGHGR